ncbi:WD40/YVTN/BNR-like repeat-containing protein [candidate division KSB1 bacterium]
MHTFTIRSLALPLIIAMTNFAAAQIPADNIQQTFRWRSIGPASMAGRVSDVEAFEDNDSIVIVASASGGVWKSTNAGTTWEPVFDSYGSGSIGDVAFYQNDADLFWVGTGEANNRNSSGWGDGIYKTTDGGERFMHMGLTDTHQIARVITHPSDRDIVYVAAVGHLWGYSGSRGLFKTTDGGETWRKLTDGLPDDDRTGATDLAIDSENPDILYAAMYHRVRKAWTFQSGGPNGGIFKSTDAGRTWKKLTNGLPTGNTGRIGLSVYRKNPRILMANIEADENLPDDLQIPGPGVYRSEDGGETWTYLYRHVSRPFYFGQIRIDPTDDQVVYLLYRSFEMSRDGGKTFSGGFRGVYGDPHAMWIDPHGSGRIYFGDDGGVHLSHDNGRSWIKFDNMAIGQYYAIGVDMRDPYWVYGGLQDQNVWGVPSRSRDRQGILNDHTFNVSGGDGFHVQVDPTNWRTVYSVAHVGYAGRQNVETRERVFITPTPATIANFDKYARADYQEDPIIYTINPGEHWLWSDLPARSIQGNILPPHFRFNWSTPLVMSPNNPRTIYFGSNYLFRSVDRGDTWMIISPDLTTNNPAKRNPNGDGGLTVDVTGAENHCTIITISESPVNDRTIWAGTDDGNVQVTTDGGTSWTNVRNSIPGIPDEIWVSRVEASHFNERTAYVSLDGHRNDDFRPYIFRTTDTGKTWTDISGDIPEGQSVYVVKEDYVNKDLLFAGTEFGCFVTLDGGGSWARLNNELPTVAVHDLVIHPRDGDVVTGTHGRSIYILDDITPLQQMTDEVRGSDLHLFQHRTATRWQNVSRGGSRGHFLYRGENPPRGAYIHFYLKSVPQGDAQVTIEDLPGLRVRTLSIEGERGINRAIWNMTFEPTPEERTGYRSRLEDIIEELGGRVTNDIDREQLVYISHELTTARSVRETNAVRQSLIENFAHFGRGIELFGFPLQPTPAPSGIYRITVTADGRTVSGTLTVRDDPILNNER